MLTARKKHSQKISYHWSTNNRLSKPNDNPKPKNRRTATHREPISKEASDTCYTTDLLCGVLLVFSAVRQSVRDGRQAVHRQEEDENGSTYARAALSTDARLQGGLHRQDTPGQWGNRSGYFISYILYHWYLISGNLQSWPNVWDTLPFMPNSCNIRSLPPPLSLSPSPLSLSLPYCTMLDNCLASLSLRTTLHGEGGGGGGGGG